MAQNLIGIRYGEIEIEGGTKITNTISFLMKIYSGEKCYGRGRKLEAEKHHLPLSSLIRNKRRMKSASYHCCGQGSDGPNHVL